METLRPNTKQATYHKYCSYCGGLMRHRTETIGYSRQTGNPSLFNLWKCCREKLGYSSHDSEQYWEDPPVH